VRGAGRWDDLLVIPTMLLVGLLIGRSWAIPVGAVAWGVVLLVTGVVTIGDVPLAAVVGGANTAVGVLVHRAAVWPFRRARSVGARSVG
jgi:hypothetical protein